MRSAIQLHLVRGWTAAFTTMLVVAAATVPPPADGQITTRLPRRVPPPSITKATFGRVRTVQARPPARLVVPPRAARSSIWHSMTQVPTASLVAPVGRGGSIGVSRASLSPAPLSPVSRRSPPRPARNFRAPVDPTPTPLHGLGVHGRRGGMVYNHPVWGQNVRAQDLNSKNQNVLRVMPPTSQYPNGYWIQHNSFGQPVNLAGKTGPGEQTHIPLPGPRRR